MLPGSNQGCDTEIKFMGLNEEKTAYVEHYKPIEEVREVILKRFSEKEVAEHEFNHPLVYERLLEFMDGKCDWEDVGVGYSHLETVRRGYRLLQLIAESNERKIPLDNVIKKIKEADTIDEIIDIFENGISNEYDEFVFNHQFYPRPSEKIQRIFSLPDERYRARISPILTMWRYADKKVATEEFDKIIRLFKLEKEGEEIPFTGTLGNNLIHCRPDFSIRIGANVKDKSALDIISYTTHSCWLPIDRSGTLKTQGLKTIGPAIPDATGFNKTLEDCMLEKAQRIWDTGRNLKVYWSGGIDSTGALVALIRTAKNDDLDRLIVCMDNKSTDLSKGKSFSSLTEYQLFFDKFIDGKLNVELMNLFEDYKEDFYDNGTDTTTILIGGVNRHIAKSVEDNYLCITGELGDQMFGSDAFANDPDLINMTSKEFLKRPIYKKHLSDIEKLNKACPIDTNKLTDMLWWWNFSTKWCEIRFRAFDCIGDNYHWDNIVNFYDTEDFQKWSISNPDKKIKKTPASYKWTLKDFIYDYTKDADYRDNKLKIGSLVTSIGSIAAIDDKYNIIKFGTTSTDIKKMKQRYGDKLSRFVTDK